MLWIGLTGSIGSGKTTVARLILSLGFPVIDADQISHEVISKGTSAYLKVIQNFGPGVLNLDGDIDRKKLGQLVFQNKNSLFILESIIHPEVQLKVKSLKEMYEAQGAKAVFYDVPLLFEKKLENQFDQIWCVYTTKEKQIERLKLRNNWNIEEIENRIQNQISMEEKAKRSTHVILNNKTIEDLDIQVKKIIEKL